jgi:cell division protein FtsL
MTYLFQNLNLSVLGLWPWLASLQSMTHNNSDHPNYERLIVMRHLSIFVLCSAIIMMGSSAIITYYITKQNDTLITSLTMEIENKQTLIKDVWNNVSVNQNKANFAILISLFAKQNNTDLSEIKDYYLSQFMGLGKDPSIKEILQAIEQNSQTNSDYINNLYFEQTALQMKIATIKQSNRLYTLIAVFLQVLGLVFIIIRKDMLSKH